MVAALLISVVVGCDDPEVQDKVADVLQYGAVSAEIHCQQVRVDLCNGAMYVNIDSHILIDGSSTMKIRTTSPGQAQGFQFNTRGQPVGMTANGTSWQSTTYQVNTSSGELTASTQCSSGIDVDSVVVDLNNESCTGRNLEAFGVTP